MSNIDDLDRLVAVFMKQEDEHFSLFNYIQTVNQETDQQLEKTEELEVRDPFATYVVMGHGILVYTRMMVRVDSNSVQLVLLRCLRITEQKPSVHVCSVVGNTVPKPTPGRSPLNHTGYPPSHLHFCPPIF